MKDVSIFSHKIFLLVSLLAHTSVRLSTKYYEAHKKAIVNSHIVKKKFLNGYDTEFRTIRLIIIITMINILNDLMEKLEYTIISADRWK